MALTALIIREPWIGKILRGEKTWELRARATRHRGEIALIRQGSGLVVGLARITGCMPAQTKEGLLANLGRHGVPVEQIDNVMEKGWVVPWVLSDVQALPDGVRYSHPSGAVNFVKLDEPTEQAIRAMLRGRAALPQSRSVNPLRLDASLEASQVVSLSPLDLCPPPGPEERNAAQTPSDDAQFSLVGCGLLLALATVAISGGFWVLSRLSGAIGPALKWGAFFAAILALVLVASSGRTGRLLAGAPPLLAGTLCLLWAIFSLPWQGWGSLEWFGWACACFFVGGLLMR